MAVRGRLKYRQLAEDGLEDVVHVGLVRGAEQEADLLFPTHKHWLIKKVADLMEAAANDEAARLRGIVNKVMKK